MAFGSLHIISWNLTLKSRKPHFTNDGRWNFLDDNEILVDSKPAGESSVLYFMGFIVTYDGGEEAQDGAHAFLLFFVKKRGKWGKS